MNIAYKLPEQFQHIKERVLTMDGRTCQDATQRYTFNYWRIYSFNRLKYLLD